MTQKEHPLVLVEKEGKIAHVTLNYPEKLNAFDFAGQGGLTDQLHSALEELEQDLDVSVVVLKGSGRAFSAGHDLSKVGFVYDMKVPKPGEKLQDRPSQRVRLNVDREFMYHNYLKLLYYPKILIAQVHGYCVAEGLMVAAMCDMMITSETAKLGLTQQRLGFAGSGGASLAIFYLSMGLRRATEMILTGRTISGKDAERFGLAARAVPEKKLEETTNAMAELVSLLPRDGVAVGKAARHLLFDAMGITNSFTIAYVTHTLFTNLKYEDDEFVFFKERRDQGTTGAIRKRNELWEQLLQKIYGPQE
ncbi:MAG: enoyl-CoA hydratase/isomerase family protein [Chloroflexota bacterium]